MRKTIRQAVPALATMIVAAALPASLPAAAQDDTPPAERDLFLECILQSGDYAGDRRLAINAAMKRARAGTLVTAGGYGSYGVRYETDEIILYPNRLPPGPGHTYLAIDRKTLALTYFRAVASDSPDRIVVGTAQCREIPPVPGLMPGERRGAR